MKKPDRFIENDLRGMGIDIHTGEDVAEIKTKNEFYSGFPSHRVLNWTATRYRRKGCKTEG